MIQVIQRSVVKIIVNSLPVIFPLFFLQFEVLYNDGYFRCFVIIAAIFGLYLIIIKSVRRKVIKFDDEKMTLFRFFRTKTFKSTDVLTFQKRNFGRSLFILKNGQKYYFNISDLREADIDLLCNHFSEKD